MSVTRWALAPMIVVAAAFVLLYLAYTRKVHEHKSLGDLYDATAAIGIARHDGTFAEELVSRVRRLLRAESATLWLPSQGREPELLIAAHEDREGVDYLSPTRPDPARAMVVRTARTYLIAPRRVDEPVIREKLAARGVTDAILTPLRSGNAIIGCLEVANRLGRAATFTRSDARLLETIAAHAGVAAENDRLIRRLSWDAYHDVLTGLANRWRFLQALEDEIAADVPPGEIVAVLLLDLDSFKDVNDTLGHAAGDQLLNEVGQRLKQIAPGGALVARLGGDEFALLVRAKGSGVIQEEAEALQRALEQPFEWDGVTLDVGGSIGIAVYPDHGTDASTLLQRADVAMYAAKGRGRGIAQYVPTMDSSSVRRLSLAADLRRAIEDGQLEVYFQPKVALTDQQLIGVEALVRWEHPEHGTVTPDDFVPIAEHTGQYLPLTRLVLNRSLAQCRTWLDQNRELTVAVNVSVRCLSDANFADEVASTLRAHRVPASMLTLEITESGVMSEIERVLPTLTKLREHGIGLSVDDFGTGYSSLAYLRRLPVTEVKIDKSFVLAMGTDPADLAIVKAILELGRHLDLTVVAEGVESEISMSLLAEMACDVAQGFLLARPLPVDRLERWIERRTVMESETAGKVRRLRVVGA
jgi:diguanylate cyclase (GGDEF)-like protein